MRLGRDDNWNEANEFYSILNKFKNQPCTGLQYITTNKISSNTKIQVIVQQY